MARRSSIWRFDPVAIGRAECDVWVGYYRHEWGLVLRSAVVMVREGFAMPWPRTLLGAWYVLRANQLWAPYPDNDPDGARAVMRRFYALARDQRPDVDPARAAELEGAGGHEHRARPRGGAGGRVVARAPGAAARADGRRRDRARARAARGLRLRLRGSRGGRRARRAGARAGDAGLRRVGRRRLRPAGRPAAPGAAA